MDELMAAQASQTEWAGVAGAAAAGQLTMHPSAAADCAKACSDASDQLKTAISQIHDAATGLDGCGVWPSGQQLKTKFVNKVANDAASAVNVLQAHLAVLDNMTKAFNDAAAAYTSTDHATADAFRAQP